jgi:hypothetical protein
MLPMGDSMALAWRLTGSSSDIVIVIMGAAS